jgi:hypothetical protein
VVVRGGRGVAINLAAALHGQGTTVREWTTVAARTRGGQCPTPGLAVSQVGGLCAVRVMHTPQLLACLAPRTPYRGCGHGGGVPASPRPRCPGPKRRATLTFDALPPVSKPLRPVGQAEAGGATAKVKAVRTTRNETRQE